MSGIAGQAGIVDALHAGMRGQELRDRLRVRAVRAHAPGQRADAAEHEPAVERRGHGAARGLDRAEPLAEGTRLARDHDAAHHVGMAGEVLRRGVHHEVEAEGQRPLQERRRPGVVAGGEGPRRSRDLHDRAQVGDGDGRVGRRLRPDEPRAGPQGGAAGRPGPSCPRTRPRGPSGRSDRRSSLAVPK